MNLTVRGVGTKILSNNNLVALRLEEYAGVRLPIAILEVNTDSKFMTEIRLGLTLTLEFESEDKALDSLEFDLIDYEEVPTSDKDIVRVNLKIVHKYYELIKTQKQELFEDTAVNVLQVYGFVDESKCTNDSQVYIRANLSEKAFYRQLIQQMYLGETDCPISSINLKEKIVKSLKETLEVEEPYIKLSKDKVAGSELFTIIKRGANSTLTDYLYGSDRVDSILKAEDNEVYYLDYKGKEIEDIEQYAEQTNLYLNPTKNDNCNCHPDYFKALIRNRTAWLALNSEKLIVQLYQKELRLDLPMLCCAEILEDGLAENELEYVGKWVVTGKYQGLNKNNAMVHLELSRIPLDYFRRVKNAN